MTLKSELELNPGHSGSPGEFGFLGIHIKHFFEKKNVCISFDIPIFDKVGPVFHDVFWELDLLRLELGLPSLDRGHPEHEGELHGVEGAHVGGERRAGGAVRVVVPSYRIMVKHSILRPTLNRRIESLIHN